MPQRRGRVAGSDLCFGQYNQGIGFLDDYIKLKQKLLLEIF